MASEEKTGIAVEGARACAGGRILELGTGHWRWVRPGFSPAWTRILGSIPSTTTRLRKASLDDTSAHDPRVVLHFPPMARSFRRSPPAFRRPSADTWAMRFLILDVALGLVRVGGIYVVDDLLLSPIRQKAHALKIPVPDQRA